MFGNAALSGHVDREFGTLLVSIPQHAGPVRSRTFIERDSTSALQPALPEGDEPAEPLERFSPAGMAGAVETERSASADQLLCGAQGRHHDDPRVLRGEGC